MLNIVFKNGSDSYFNWVFCIGPFTEQTIVDFWRMVWQVKSRRIVMLTCLTEDSKVCMLEFVRICARSMIDKREIIPYIAK